jgi:outer membrane protein assembly factor BamA
MSQRVVGLEEQKSWETASRQVNGKTAAMRKHSTNVLPKLVLFLVTAVLGVTGARGQELLRNSLAGADVAEARILSVEEQNYNLRFGSLRFQFSANTGIEYNDNISYSDVNRTSDAVAHIGVDIRGTYPITKLNTLALTLGVGYVRYLVHPSASASDIYITPGSEVSFDIFAGDMFRINLHDRFDLRQDPIDAPSLSSVTNFARFTNTAGVTVVADLNTVVLTAGYDHFNYLTLNSDFDYLDRSAEQFLASAVYQIAPRTFIGLEGTASLTNYDDDTLGDSSGYSLGMYFDITPTPYLRFIARGGYQYAAFEGSTYSRAPFNDDKELNAFYWNLTLNNRINAYLSQNLTAGRENDLGLTSNYLEVNYVRYNIGWRIFSNTTLGGDAFFEDDQESGGLFNEHLNRYGGDITLGYQFNLRLSASAHYAYIQKDSDVALRDYYQNRVGVDVFYRF